MDISDLIRTVNIVDYLSQYVDLTQRGDEWWGLSCFKHEKTPSFSVRLDPPVFYDYSSGIGGNIYTFTKHYFNCSGREAVDIIKKYAGYEGEIDAPREKMSATLTCRKFSKPKRTVKESKATVLPENYMERYERPPEKLAVWENEGISKDSLDRFQVCYDAFSDRLVYPIRNTGGEIVNIGGRTLDPEWKEKKLRKYCYFYQWGMMDTIYGIAENIEYILEKREVILFEGCKSVLIADSWGIKNCGAILTSHLSPAQMKILARLGVHVVFALDKDVDILKDHNVAKLKRYVNVEYIKDSGNLLSEKDAPVDKGKAVFEKLYAERYKYR